MTAVVKANPALPESIKRLMAAQPEDAVKELTGGVTSGFPVISYKGKVWSVRKSGELFQHLDKDGNAMPTIDVVLIQSNHLPSKIFYAKPYEEGSTDLPDCYSNDGIRPDVSIQNPVNDLCASCPNNVWGSRITDSGKKSRLCSDSRRMAVGFINEITEQGKAVMPLLLRVPPASLNPLKEYAERVLSPKGLPFYGIVTRIGFDPQAAHPQFTFKPQRFLNDEEAEVIAALRGSPDVLRILAEAEEFAAGATAGNGAAESAQTPAPASRAPATPKTATTAPAAKPRPAAQEEAGADAIAPAPPTKAATKAAAKPTPKPAPAVKPKPAPPAAEAEGEFDDLLDVILNG